jgi:epoxyqueuosine reductase
MTLDPERVKAVALELGFLACGITDPRPSAHAAQLDEWIARGYAGTMRYLHRQAAKRKDPRRIAPAARSVVVVLDNYYQPDGPEDRRPPKVAKYARGRDYHRVTLERLDRLGRWLRDQGATFTRSFADAGPVPERELAQRAGLGWIGKNTMLLHPGLGSFFFIGSVFTDLVIPLDAPFASDHCGSCTRCLDACPTGAFVAPRVLDATRCISYLTIEQKGPIPDALASHLDGWAFGCDVCNDVCPWNHRFARPTAVPAFRSAGHLRGVDADTLERMDEETFARRFGGTPLERPGLAGMRRNVRAALTGVSPGGPDAKFPAMPPASDEATAPATIRLATPADAARLARFGERVFRDTYASQVPASDMALHLEHNYGDAQQSAELRDPRSACLLAEVGGELAGYALLRIGRGPGDEPALAAPVEIARFYVAREWHGRGVAQRLMAAAAGEARERGGKTLWLTVWTENPRAIAFYRKQGFTPAGTTRFRLGTLLHDDYVMTRDLSGEREATASPASAAGAS